MRLRSEFVLLEKYYQQLRANVGVTWEFLTKVKDHLDLCEKIIEDRIKSADGQISMYYREKVILDRAKYWWEERASAFGMVAKQKPPTSLVLIKHKFELTAKDRQFLRSLRISEDDNVRNGVVEDEDDCA